MTASPVDPALSWGRVVRAEPASVVRMRFRDEDALARAGGSTVLPRGLGRSYGDSCLNGGGTLVDTTRLDRLVSFDPAAGRLRCEAGARLGDLLAFLVPRGFFLPVVPGTRDVTVGGAIANDVHGKNHHVAGTFGSHVGGLELLRPGNERTWCSPAESPDLFRATVGGLGLTGVILQAELALRPIGSPHVEAQEVRFGRIDDFHALERESSASWEYTVAWVDTLARGSALGRGIYIRGRHASGGGNEAYRPARPRLGVPCDAPSFLLAPAALKLFNAAWYRLKGREESATASGLDAFFFPLDSVGAWNRLYGRRGFYQYQCVLPPDRAADAAREILTRTSRAGQGSFLAVLKAFGDRPSPGLLSFPRPGTTLAMDFPNLGPRTLRLLEELDGVVSAAGGALYPAKDARMPPALFDLSFPGAGAFERFVSPGFSSTFWRRVRGSARA